MTITNHALTGAFIGFVVGNPIIAIPAAILSHFVCDALPHFDVRRPADVWIKTTAFRRLITVDATLCVIIVLILAIARPEHWLLASVCAFAATSPDMLWINRFIETRRGKVWHGSKFMKLAEDIQWFSRPPGAIVEVAWLTGILILLAPFVL